MPIRNAEASHRLRVGPLLAVVLLAGACAPSGTPRDDAGDSGDSLRIEGTLTDEGVECPALRGRDGELYTLAGDLKGYAAGDQVWVEGAVAQISFCMQGTTIAVERIGSLKAGP